MRGCQIILTQILETQETPEPVGHRLYQYYFEFRTIFHSIIVLEESSKP